MNLHYETGGTLPLEEYIYLLETAKKLYIQGMIHRIENVFTESSDTLAIF